MNANVVLRGRTTNPFGSRRQCDVCGLIQAEHADLGGNCCYRRAIAAYFPMSAPARQTYETPLEARQAAVRGAVLQVTVRPLWDRLRGKEG